MISEWKLKDLPTAALELLYRAKFGGVRLLVGEAKDAAERNDFGNVYLITKGLACGHKSFDGPVKDVTGQLLIHDDEQLNRWKKRFTMVPNRITSGDAPPFVDEIAMP